ncbi:MAG: Hsp20/alpha crystallin family protein [Planctomycetes bacterium]|nr:Hsp20/alpha crystallin family protein [Planctomycetota bacterium]
MENDNDKTLNPTASAPVKEQRPVYVPPAEITEEENCWKIRAIMPGVKSDSLEITLTGNELHLLGRATDMVPQGMRLIYHEYEPGDYERTFTISDHVKREGIGATVKDGVLVLTLPKAEAVRPVRIPVVVK